ncbi:MAG: deoxyguanosinetriphosphate triphosphohydrolase [Desulfobulbaceae bacterium]|nr:deoxyguanosinetriphosphate triphosphohydrolase [Desulfobulbaceae bacterium]
MEWKKLLSPQRFMREDIPPDIWSDVRTEFQRDFDRIIFSTPFRRLQNKTQVFPLPEKIFVHNRLTHSLEVASVGRSIGNQVFKKIKSRLSAEETEIVSEIGSVVATACLVHDLGNPPFGHSGEKAISNFFVNGKGAEIKTHFNDQQFNDLAYFEGNANLLRLLTHQFNGRRKGGYALTYATLATTIKYPFSSLNVKKQKKYGHFYSENDTFRQIIEHAEIPKITDNPLMFARHPLVYLVEAADDICYQIMDMEDAMKLNIMSKNHVRELFMEFFDDKVDANRIAKIKNTVSEVTDANEQMAFIRAMVIGKLTEEAANAFVANYDSIMNGTFESKLLKCIGTKQSAALKNIGDIAFAEVYNHPSVVKIEIAGYNVLGFLMQEFSDAILNPNADYSRKLLSLFPSQYRSENDSIYDKMRSVVDFISGMTDTYAVSVYRQIKGIDI